MVRHNRQEALKAGLKSEQDKNIGFSENRHNRQEALKAGLKSEQERKLGFPRILGFFFIEDKTLCFYVEDTFLFEERKNSKMVNFGKMKTNLNDKNLPIGAAMTKNK